MRVLIGAAPIIAAYRGGTLLWQFSPPALFFSMQSGFYAGGYAPAE